MTTPQNPTSPPTASAIPELSERARWRAFAICVAVAALTILDFTKVNVGLPSIEHSLGAQSSDLQIIVAGYALAFGLALVPAGRLGDIHSRKLMFVIGLCLFTVASLVCALAPSITVLLFARVVQGVAGGILMPQVLGLVQQLFQGKERGRAFGVFGAMVGIATAFGPTLGGLLIAIGGPTDGWRWLFWMNIPLGVAALVLAIRLVPANQQHERRRLELDIVGILLLGVATFTLMLPFVLTTGGPNDDPRRWLSLLLSAAATCGFIAWERNYAARGKSPVLHFALFKLPSYRNGLLVAAVYFAAMPATFLVVTLYLQQGLGLPPVFAGMVGLPFALAQAGAAWIGGRMVDTYGRRLVVLGLVIVLVGFTGLLLAAVLTPPEVTPWAMAAAMLFSGVGGGLVVSPNQTLTLADVPVTQAGVSGSMAQVGQRVGMATGIAAATSVFFATLYQESGTSSNLAAYHDGFRNGLVVTLSLVALALVIGLLDLHGRRRRARAAQSASTGTVPVVA